MTTLQQIQNELTRNSRVLRHAAFGGVYIGKDGKVHSVPMDSENGIMDFTGLLGSGGGTIVNPDNPSGTSDEDNYYAGSLANGEITDRDLLWQGPSDPDQATTATLVKDPGSKFNMIGDGSMITAHLRKTIMTNGTKGAVSTVPMLYDPTNTARAGYYVTTSSYPAFVLASHFVVGKKLTVPFNGIGENLSGKNVKAPTIHLTFNADKTMTIENETGYDNDGNSAGATGANYDIIVDSISTYSTQTAVSQLPTSINLFVGQASGEVALAGTSDYFENAMDGIEITFDDYVLFGNSYRFKASEIGIPSAIKISKDMLNNGYVYDLTKRLNLKSGGYVTVEVNSNSGWSALTQQHYVYSLDNINIEVGKGSITFNSNVKITLYEPAKGSTQIPNQDDYFINIDRITPYKI